MYVARCRAAVPAWTRCPVEQSRSLALRSWRSVATSAAARAADEESWRRARQKAQQRTKKAGGESPPGAIPVGNFAALGVGLLGAAWYAGYFETNIPKPDRMLKWLEDRKITVVVFELDYTMSAAASGDGLPKHELEDFMELVSEDFVVAVKALAKHDIKLAVATRGDPAQYELPGRSRADYLVGADLARLVIQRRCPEALPSFGIIVGYDPELHRGSSVPPEDRGRRRRGRSAAPAPVLLPVPRTDIGKRHHMRKIAEHYQVEPKQLVLFDSSQEMLENEDGWTGVLVTDRKLGFQFDDCLNEPSVRA